MDLSKAFDCLSHELLIAKLEAYGFGKNSLRFLYSYLRNRKQRVRLGSSLSDWLTVLLGVPQGSILGPILFNIFINDLLFFIKDSSICNFADDNTLSVCDISINRVLIKLERDLQIATNWFHNNSLVANPSKFQILLLGEKDSSSLSLKIDGKKVYASKAVKLLGVTIDEKLCFVPHVKDICDKANKKTKALLRIRSYLTQAKAEILCNSFILSALNYCPLIWMFCGKTGDNLIKTAHRRSLRAMLNDFDSTYEQMLEKSKQPTIHQKNLRILLSEVFKSLNSLNPEFMSNLFPPALCSHSLRPGSLLAVPRAKTNIGLNSMVFRATLAWNHLPNAPKQSVSISSFKKEISLLQVYCKCKICSI